MKRIFKLILIGFISFILFMSIFVIAERAVYSKKRDRNTTFYKEPRLRYHHKNKPKLSPLVDAIRTGDIDKLKILITNDSIANAKFASGRTPLIEAVRENKFEVAEFLIEKNADVNVIGRGELPLTTAVINKNRAIVKLLIENEADINKVHIRNRTALYYSAMLGNIEITKYLLSNGANIILPSNSKRTKSVISHALHLNRNILTSNRQITGRGIITQYIDRNYHIPNPKLEAEIRDIQNKRIILDFLVENCTDERVIDTYERLIKTAYENQNTLLARKMFSKIPQSNKEAYEEVIKYAAEAGDFQIVKELVEAGTTISDFTKKSIFGSIIQGPIIYAAANGNLEILKYLLQNREFNFQKSKYRTEYDSDPELTHSLKQALKNKHSNTAIFLMDNGASLTNLPEYGACNSRYDIQPIQLAVENNLLKVVEYLIDKGIKSEEKSLQIAIKKKHYKIEKIIREQFDIPQEADAIWAKTVVSEGQITELSKLDSLFESWMKIDLSDGCLLRIACENNHYEFVEFLLKKGANPNLRPDNTKFSKYSFPQDNCHSRENPTALMYACKNMNTKMIKLLLKYKADVNALNAHNNNALFYLLNNHTGDISSLKEMFILLCDHGIETTMALKNLKIFHKENQTKEFIELIDLLIGKGADMNYPGPIEQGRSHNHLIVKLVTHSQPEVIEHVIKKGIDLSYRDEQGKNLLMIKNLRLVNYKSYIVLLESGIDLNEEDIEGNTILHYLIRSFNIDVFRKLPEYDLDWNHKNKKGETPLMKLVKYRSDYEEIFKILIQQNVDMNAKDNDGNSVIFHLLNRPKICNLLIENGVKIDVKDADGNTPFLKCIIKRYWKQAKVFIDKGADINMRNNNNESALMILVKWFPEKSKLFYGGVFKTIIPLLQYIEKNNHIINDFNKAEEILKTKGYNSFEELFDKNVLDVKVEILD